jgi:oligopeptide transport system permease protein
VKARSPYVRTAATALLALLAFLVLRHRLPALVAGIVSVVAAAAAARFAPRLVLVRLLWTAPLLLLLVFVTIQLMFLAPGDPFASEKNAPEAVRRQQQEHYGILDRSPAGGAAFFARYLGTLVSTGYLGPSMKVEGQSVGQLLLPALPVSVTLGLSALLLAVAMGLVLGVRAGLRPNSFVDGSSMAFAMVGISVPSFVIGALLMVVFSLGLGWFPVAGWGGYRHLVLPAVTLSLPYAAYVARLARSGTIEVMSQDFVRTARAKGLPERAVVLKHALRGALAPVVSFLGPAAAGIMTGSFVVEMLFGIPGMGQWFVKGAINRDYYVVLGTVLIYSGIVVLFNLLVDLAYAWLDPRLRGRS